MKQKKTMTTIILALLSLDATAKPEYIETPDEFGEGSIHAVRVESKVDSIPSTLLVRCTGPSKISVTLATSRHTMFPDDLTEDGKYMRIATTYKFSGDTKAVTNDWAMAFMKYKAAHMGGDAKAFIRSALKSDTLSIKQLTRSDIYRFNLVGGNTALTKMVEGCNIKL